jgi:hypothetical protein
MSEHDVAAKCARQVADLQAENERLLTGLRAAKLFAATQAAKVGNGFLARGEWHKLAEQLQAVIDGPDYVPPDVIYEAALEVRAGTPHSLQVLEVE